MKPHLGAHLCRCTGYVKILDAIESVAQGRTCAPALSGTIGGGGAKYEAAELTLGDRGYVDDLRVPGMLHAALRLTDHARADVTAIDTAAALAADGVVAVFTADDIAGELRVGLIHKDWPVMIPVGGRTSCAGDVLAIVVAETRQQARAAAELVDVGYDVHTPNTDPVAALAEGSPLSVWGTESNTLSTSAYQRGDAVDARAGGERPRGARDVPHAAHRARLPRARVDAWPCRPARRRAASLHVYSGGQGVWDDRNDIAAVLGRRPLAGHGRAGVERWRLRRQGRHGEPGPDGAGGVAARPSGEVHAVARGELADPRQAPPDHARVSRPGATPTAGSPGCACAASATRVPTPASA